MKMQLILNLQPFQREKLFSHVTNSREMMAVYLSALEYIQYWHGNSRVSRRPFMLVDLDETHRVFLVDKDKIISFAFLLNIKLNGYDLNDISNYVRGIFLQNHKISAREISEAKQILSNCAEPNSLYCYNVLDEDSSLSEESIYLFEHLLFVEWGYIRFDHDPSHAITGIHPVEHFDINYSSPCSYKIGLNRQVKVEDVINMLNKRTACVNINM